MFHYLNHLIFCCFRANYGRFSIALCNAGAEQEWSVNCFTPGASQVLRRRSVSNKRYKMLTYIGSWFWGALFPRTADLIFHESLCLHPPSVGLCPKTLHLDIVIPP